MTKLIYFLAKKFNLNGALFKGKVHIICRSYFQLFQCLLNNSSSDTYENINYRKKSKGKNKSRFLGNV